jgi:hypothetical protein
MGRAARLGCERRELLRQNPSPPHTDELGEHGWLTMPVDMPSRPGAVKPPRSTTLAKTGMLSEAVQVAPR